MCSRRQMIIILSNETKETPVEETEDYLANMQSQIDGIKNWKAELKKLSKTKLAKGIIEELEALGPEGTEQIKYFLNLSEKEIEKANSLYAEKLGLDIETLLGNYSDNEKAIKKWANDIATLVRNNFDKSIVEAIGNAGMDKGKSYMELFLSMTPEQIEALNQSIKNGMKLSEAVANAIVASYAEVGADAYEAYKNGYNEASENDETVTLSATAKQFDGSAEGATDSIDDGKEEVATEAINASKESAEAV